MITKTELQNFRKDFTEAVKELEKKYGFKIELGNINYTMDSFTAKLMVNDVKSAMKDGVSAEQAMWNNHCAMFGLKPSDFGQTLNINGAKYKIVGIAPNCRKNCVIIENESNVTYKTSHEAVRRQLHKEVTI